MFFSGILSLSSHTHPLSTYRSSRSQVFFKIGALKKETLAKVFSYEFCEISKNTYFTEHLWTTASVNQAKPWKKLCKNYHKYTKTIYNDKKTFIVSWMSTHLTKHHLFFMKLINTYPHSHIYTQTYKHTHTHA